MEKLYIDSMMLFERLWRLFLVLVKKELSALKIDDITPTQALIIYHINHHILKVGDIMKHKLYLGSNISYTIKKMEQHAYLILTISKKDRRTSHVQLSEKGKVFCDQFSSILELHTRLLCDYGLESGCIKQLLQNGYQLEHLWNQIFFSLSALERRLK